VPAADLFDREPELRALGAALDAAERGDGAALLVEGPPGIGKTSLLAVAEQRARDRGALVCAARGAEIERDWAWGAARRLLEPALAGAGDDVLRGPAGAAARSIGIDGGEPAAGAPADAFAVMHGLSLLAGALAERAPLVLVLDDLHWCDEPSVRWIGLLATRVAGQRIAVLAGTRPVEGFASSDGMDVVSPGALSTAAAARVIAGRLGRPAEDRFVEACHWLTAGNPFLLGELARELAVSGSSGAAGEADAVSALRPSTVARSVLLRLARLPDPALEVARSVAIAGDARPADVAALSGVPEAELAEPVRALVAANVLEDAVPLSFVHPLVAAVVRDDIPALERDRRHRHAARLLADRGAPARMVAAHLLASEPAGEEWARAALREAGREALAGAAPEVALTLLRRAVAECGGAPEPALLAELGRADFAANGAPGLDHLRAAFAGSADPEERGRIALMLGPSLLSLGAHPEAVSVYDAALGDLSDGPLLRIVEAQLIHTALYETETIPLAFAHLERAVGALGSGGPEDAIVLGVLALASAATGSPDAVGYAHRALAAAGDEPADPTVVSVPLQALVWSEEVPAAIEAWDRIVEHARRYGSRPSLAFATCFRSAAALRLGRVAEAAAFARESAGYSGLWALTPPEPAAFLCEALLELGRFDEAESALEGSGYDRALPPRQGYVPLLMSRGRLHAARGRHAEAAEDFLDAGARLGMMGLTNPLAHAWREEAAIALSRSDPERAVALAEEAVAAARACGHPRAVGTALRAAALSGPPEARVDGLAEAVEALEDAPAPLERARALLDLGVAHRRERRTRDAREILGRAQREADLLGALALSERAREELRLSGARPRRDASHGVASLTESELRVARRAADGRTNREIAQDLWLSPKTVEIHLTHAYAKLDIRSRRELAGALDA
jgi:DNA-binding CsgD family transcriptional regulator